MGRTIAACPNAADDIEPAADGKAYKRVWNHWVVLGATSRVVGSGLFRK